MLIRIDLIEDEQWIILISLVTEDYNTSTSLLTDSEEEQIIIMADQIIVGDTSQENCISNNMM